MENTYQPITNHNQLETRLKNFSFNVLKKVKSLPHTEENKIYGKQVIRSSSSIGANYAEALCAHTKPDFLHDLNKSRKESRETVYWLELISLANPSFQAEIQTLLTEGNEIFKIFMSSVKTMKINIEKGQTRNHK